MALCITPLGWAVIVGILAGTSAVWGLFGESFFAHTYREPGARVLVVEGWIGYEGLGAAALEYTTGGYDRVITTSGMTNERWGRVQWNYAVSAKEELMRRGIPEDRIIAAPPLENKRQRTFESAVAVLQALRALKPETRAVNIFTIGAHARRSRLIFAKVFGGDWRVGSVAWIPNDYRGGQWWRSSERAEDMVKETVGYFFELFFSSGRGLMPAASSASPSGTRPGAGNTAGSGAAGVGPT